MVEINSNKVAISSKPSSLAVLANSGYIENASACSPLAAYSKLSSVLPISPAG
jgi:hypothetical protein